MPQTDSCVIGLLAAVFIMLMALCAKFGDCSSHLAYCALLEADSNTPLPDGGATRFCSVPKSCVVKLLLLNA